MTSVLDYNPEARRLIEEAGCHLIFLPPRGKYFNPIELFFGTAKNHIRSSYSGSRAAQERRHRTDRELIQAIFDGCASVSSAAVEGFYRERAGLRSFLKAFPAASDFVAGLEIRSYLTL
jgi:hypothetical protein